MPVIAGARTVGIEEIGTPADSRAREETQRTLLRPEHPDIADTRPSTERRTATSEAIERLRQSLHAESEALRAELPLYKGAGLELKHTFGITIGEDQLTVDGALNLPQSFTCGSLSSPRFQLHFQYAQAKEIPAPLRQSNEVLVYPFSLSSAKTGPKEGVVTIYDHLQDKVLLEQKVSLTENGRLADPARELGGVRRKLTEFFAQYAEAHRKTLSGIVPDAKAADEMTYQVEQPGHVPEAQRRTFAESMDRLSKKHLIIKATGMGKEIDISPLVELDREHWEKVGSGSIIVRGQIDSICASRQMAAKVDPSKKQVDGTPYTWTERSSDGQFMQHGWVTYYGRKDLADRFVEICPPIPFLPKRTGKPTFVPVDLDLTALGGAKVEGLLYQQALEPLTEAGAYRIYTNMDEATVRKECGAEFDKMADGAAKAEALFGQAPGSKLQHIYVANSRYSNASFMRANPTTIVMQDELLKEREAPDRTAFHETIHLLDEAFGRKLTGGAFKANYGRRSQSFLFGINEKNFMPSCKEAGHAQDNESELLASFAVSLTHPEWEQTMRTKTPEFRREYRETLQALLSTAKSIKEIPQDAPLFVELQKKLDLLSRM